MKLLSVVTPPSIYHCCSTWKTFWEEKFTGKENLFLAVDMKHFGRRNVRKHKEIKGSDRYVTLNISSNFDSLDKSIQISKCIMISDNLNWHDHGGYNEMTSPSLNVNVTDKDE